MSWFKWVMYILFFVFFTWFYGAIMGGDLHQLQPYLSSGLYLIAGLVLGLMNYTATEIAAAFRISSSPVEADSPEGIALSRKVIQSMGNYPLVIGVAATVLHTVGALSNLGTVHLLVLGLAAALLPLWFGIGFRFFVLYPFEVALEKRACLIEREGI